MRASGIILIAALLLFMLLTAGCVFESAPPLSNISYHTENYPPFNMEKKDTQGQVSKQGISIDLLRTMTKELGTEVTDDQIHVNPWSQSQLNVILDENSVLFFAYRNSAREGLYKWVGPIGEDGYVMFAKTGSQIRISDPEDLKQYKIGAITGDAGYTYLKEAGVSDSQMVLDSDFTRLINRLINGDIDLICYGESTGQYIAKNAGKSGRMISVYKFPQTTGWFGFNRQMPDSFVQSFQKALDTIKTRKDSSGKTEYQKIFDKYTGAE